MIPEYIEEVIALGGFNPNQPRDPRGSPTGGQFASSGASGGVGTHVVAATSLDGRTVYWDGFGWTLLKGNAKKVDAASAVSLRSHLASTMPDSKITEA